MPEPMSDLQRQMVREIRILLAVRDWTQGDLGARAGLSRTHVQALLNGRREGTFDVWSRLFGALGYEIALSIAEMQERPRVVNAEAPL